MRIAVIGGGIAGLAAANRCQELGFPGEVVLLEAGDRVGGLIATERHDGFVIEHGPDSIITEKPAALALIKRLGLEDQLVRTSPGHAGAYVVARSKLQKVPDGFALLAPMRFRPMLLSPILSPWGKIRAGFDLVLPRGPAGRDESLADFVTRRFGREVLDRLAQPLASGIYGTDPALLSLRATMPRFLDAEEKHRSVALALRKRRPRGPSAGARYGLFVSFQNGMQTLVDELETRLRPLIRTGARVDSIGRAEEGKHRIALEGGETVTADAVVFATPAWKTADLISDLVPDAAGLLREIPYGSSATVTFAFKRDQIAHALDAYGFVVPSLEERPLIACTWASEKYPGRAPEGMSLIRLFLGGPGREEMADWPEQDLRDAAYAQLAELIGVQGEPVFHRVHRYHRALPKFHVGHLARIDQLDDTMSDHPVLGIAGNAYRGVGVPDAIRSGEEAAERVVRGLGVAVEAA